MKSEQAVIQEHRDLKAIALALMPLFRDKFDYSNEKEHQKQHTDLAFNMAREFVKSSDAAFLEMRTNWLKDKEAEREILKASGQTGDIVTTPMPKKVEDIT